MTRTANPHDRPMLPPRLKKGDTIGIVAPAGALTDQEAFTKGARLLAELGFTLKFDRDINQRRAGYLAGNDADRAREFTDLWADPEVKALMAVRGGFGALRLLPHLDMELIRSHPKILIGFSDISVLLTALWKHVDLVTLHGPMLTTLATSDDQSIHHLIAILTSEVPPPIKAAGLEILRAGRTKGPLLGGNLASLVHLLGTPYEVSWENAVVLLEEVNEAPYRIDRMLTHLQAAGRLEKLAGIVLGEFTDCGDNEVVWQRVLELTAATGVPVWGNFPAGHGKTNIALPLGAEVEMDGNTGTLCFHSPCFSNPCQD